MHNSQQLRHPHNDSTAVFRLNEPTVIMVQDENKQQYEEFNSIDLSREEDYSIKNILRHGAYGIKMDELFL